MMIRVSTKPTEFIIKSHTSTNKARTLAQMYERSYEWVWLKVRYRIIPTINEEEDYGGLGLM
jgi:asparagine N-glycosylation enzyme membrane subunit Stt3